MYIFLQISIKNLQVLVNLCEEEEEKDKYKYLYIFISLIHILTTCYYCCHRLYESLLS